jgi:prevent-host-death family protein
MTTINMHDAKTQLSDLVARAEAGEEIVIARRNKPAVRLVAVRTDDRAVNKPKRRLPALTPEQRAALAPLAEIDWFEHAPDDYISKEDIAAYYRKYPHEWEDMRQRVGFAKDSQAGYDAGGLREAVEQGRVYTIMKDGKPVAKVVPVEPEQKSRGWGAWEGRYSLPDTFFDPLPEEELRAWEGSDEPPA